MGTREVPTTREGIKKEFKQVKADELFMLNCGGAPYQWQAHIYWIERLKNSARKHCKRWRKEESKKKTRYIKRSELLLENQRLKAEINALRAK